MSDNPILDNITADIAAITAAPTWDRMQAAKYDARQAAVYFGMGWYARRGQIPVRVLREAFDAIQAAIDAWEHPYDGR